MRGNHRSLLEASQILTGVALALSVIGMFSEGIEILWTGLRVIGSIALTTFYIIIFLYVDSGSMILEVRNKSFLVASIILSILAFIAYVVGSDPRLYGIDAFRTFGYNFILFLLTSIILSQSNID